MKYLKIIGLGLFVFLSFISIYIVSSLVINTRIPESTLVSSKIINSENIINPSLASDKVTITIGSEVHQLPNPAFILIEDKAGKVTVISSSKLKESPQEELEHKENHEEKISSNKLGNNSINEFLLQIITASGSANAIWRCTGPYVNSNGEVVPRTCQWI